MRVYSVGRVDRVDNHYCYKSRSCMFDLFNRRFMLDMKAQTNDGMSVDI